MAKKDKAPVQDIPEEENVITPDEFEELERKEKKSRIFKEQKRPPKPGPAKKEEEPKESDRLVFQVEKIEAKLETMEGLRQATDEKISRLSEEIGELRSSILEKDKTFNQVESGFEKVKEIFDELQPKKIRAELDRKEDAIEKLGAKVEAFDTKISDMKKNMSDVLNIMDKIKDLKNVVAVSETITKKMARIEEERKETAKIAAKVESMFAELTEKMSEFHNYRDKIEFSSESMHDIMKSLDMMEVRIENAVKKDDMKKVDDRLEQMEADLTDKVRVIRDIVDDLVDSLKSGGVKDILAKEGKSRIDEINKKLSEISQYDKSLKDVKEELARLKQQVSSSPAEGLKAQTKSKKPSIQAMELAPVPVQPDAQAGPATEGLDMDSLMELCHDQIDRGDVEAAKKTYGQILSMYEQSKDTLGPGADQAYGKIKRLYYRLQVH